MTGFEIRRFSNGDLHATDSQVNYKYVQMDVRTLTDGLSPNIHRSTAIASIIPFACFRLLRIIRFSIAWYHKHYCAKAYPSTRIFRGLGRAAAPTQQPNAVGPLREVCAGRRQQEVQEDAVPPVAGADDLDRDRRLRCPGSRHGRGLPRRRVPPRSSRATGPGAGVAGAPQVERARQPRGRRGARRVGVVREGAHYERQAAATDDAETPADYVFESSIDISGMTQKDKLLLTTLARYDFMRDGMTRLIEEEYIDVVRSPDAQWEDGDYYMVDAA
ncbi:hypothetical protein THAOC_11884, partial [Thalassiosira oceanica]